MVLILKQIIFEAGLSDPYFGGISSYAIILMVVSYMQFQSQ